jgi:hypothetical protein
VTAPAGGGRRGAPRGEAIPAAPKPGGKGIIVINAAAGSRVVVDGKPVGAAPVGVRVGTGNHTVVVTNSSGRKLVRAVNVENDSRQTLRF